jgi:hypothetical protein
MAKILVVDDEPHILEVLGVPKLCKTLIEFTPLRSLSRTLLPCSDTAEFPLPPLIRYYGISEGLTV